MKSLFKHLVIISMVVLFTGLSSCGKDYLKVEPSETIPPSTGQSLEEIYSPYIKDYATIKCKSLFT